MSYHYLNPNRADDPHYLPSIETFKVKAGTPVDGCPMCSTGEYDCDFEGTPVDNHNDSHVGWYWQSCLPGCLPDGEAYGPFTTEALALEDAREGIDNEDDEDDGEEGNEL